jgi:hypothetical protein
MSERGTKAVPADLARAIIAEVARAHALTRCDITGPSRTRACYLARYEAYARVAEAVPGASHAAVARHFGGRHPTTVLAALAELEAHRPAIEAAKARVAAARAADRREAAPVAAAPPPPPLPVAEIAAAPPNPDGRFVMRGLLGANRVLGLDERRKIADRLGWAKQGPHAELAQLARVMGRTYDAVVPSAEDGARGDHLAPAAPHHSGCGSPALECLGA